MAASTTHVPAWEVIIVTALATSIASLPQLVRNSRISALQRSTKARSIEFSWERICTRPLGCPQSMGSLPLKHGISALSEHTLANRRRCKDSL